MKRRSFLEFAATLVRAVPGAFPFGVAIAASKVADRSGHEDDWLLRSTGPGVLWAHDFREDAEFHNFHRGTSTPYGRGVRTNPRAHPYHATLVPTPFGGSRAIKSSARGTRLTRDVPTAQVGEIQTWHVADIAEIEEPWDGEYALLVNARENVYVQSRDVAQKTITVRRTRKYSYLARKTTIGSGPQGRWIRPTAAFQAGMNGKKTDDQGLQNGAARKPRDWNPSDPAMHAKFREGYFGHRSYWDPSKGPATFANWTPKTSTSNETRKDAWEGDEFYVQFRARVSELRLRRGMPIGKMIYIQNCTTSGNGQFYWRVGPRLPTGGDRWRTDVPASWKYGSDYGMMLQASTAYGDSTAIMGGSLSMPAAGIDVGSIEWEDGKREVVWQQHPDSFPDARFRGGPPPSILGWHFPADRWVTYLVHIKPGRDSVVEYANAKLRQPMQARVYADKATETIYLDDISKFPEVKGPGNYPYYVHTARSRAPQLHEHMRVIDIDRSAGSLTVERNVFRNWSDRRDVREAALGWEAGAPIAYGPYRNFPGTEGMVSWPYRVSRDKRLQYRETVVEIFVAVEGETEYTKITSYDQYAWLFGDEKGEYMKYRYNPPGLNSIELSQYLNDYIGSGAEPPPPSAHSIEYTQVIFSREFIPAPRV